jgi:hypothetical protein
VRLVANVLFLLLVAAAAFAEPPIPKPSTPDEVWVNDISADQRITSTNRTLTKVRNVSVSTTTTQTASNSATWVDADLHSVSITVSTGSSVHVSVRARAYATAAGVVYATICRGSTELSGSADGMASGGPGTGDAVVPIAIDWVDSPTAGGTYTYKVQFRSSSPTINFGSATQTSFISAAELP